MRNSWQSIVFCSSVAVMASSLAAATPPPATPRRPVVDTYHGTKVVDPYRWLEDGRNAEVRRWSDAQNAYARTYLDRLPRAATIGARVRAILSAKTVSYGSVAYRAGRYFALVQQPPRQQPFLVVLDSLAAPLKTRTILDPNRIDTRGTTSIDWYEPSADGRLVAVSLSQGGSEAGDVHVVDVATGRQRYEVIPRVNTGTAGGDLAWVPDAGGFYYTRHPRGDERPEKDRNFYQQVYYHRLGTPTADDRYELGKDFPRIAECELEMHAPTETLLATVQYGDSGRFAHYLRSKSGQWRQISRFDDPFIQGTFGAGNRLVFVSRAEAPRGKIVCVSLDDPDLSRARTLVPQNNDTIVTTFYHAASSVRATDTRIYVTYQRGGPSEVRVFDYDGRRLASPKQLPVAAVSGLVRIDADDVLFRMESYVQPPAIYRLNAAGGQTTTTALQTRSPVDFDGVRVVREFATSKDGTKIPVNIMLPRDAQRDGAHPIVVYGYGGYAVSLTPRFDPLRHILLSHGILFAVANLRGGSEFGETWHRQGNLTRKQNVFDDFAAAIQHVVKRGYAAPGRVAIMGGSNGGLLMGALLTQHPELIRCVVSFVGIYDMLRVERSANGVFNIPEYGTVKNLAQFRALYAYSPYHHVRAGVNYPPTLFLTGANDPRVDPMQSRKMTARLQAAAGKEGGPILLRTSADSGHGHGTSLEERIKQYTDVYAFLFNQLGVR